MKKIIFSLILFLPFFVLADDGCGSVSVNDDTIYRVCDGEVTKNDVGEDIKNTYGLTLEDGVLHINDGDVYLLAVEGFDGLKISVDTESVVNTLYVSDSNITITGEGILNLGYVDMPVIFNNSKVTFDNANVKVGSDKEATPPAYAVRSSIILSGLGDDIYSLLQFNGSEVNINNSKFNVDTIYDDGIELDQASKLNFNNSDVKIVAGAAGIVAFDNGTGIEEESSFSKVVIKNTNLNIEKASVYGIFAYDVENNNSNVVINLEENVEEESAAIYGVGRLASVNGVFHVKGFDYGLYVTDPNALQLEGGIYDVKADKYTIVLADINNKGSFNLNGTLVALMGSNEVVEIDEGDYKVYTFGKKDGDVVLADKEILLKGYENITVTEGQGQSFYEGTQSNLVFKINRTSKEYFEKILLNGEVVDPNDYTIEGDTVTISQRVISKLAIGEYVFTVKYVEGEAKVNVSIIEKEAENPFTGSLLGYVVIAGMILLICTAFIVMKHSWVSE